MKRFLSIAIMFLIIIIPPALAGAVEMSQEQEKKPEQDSRAPLDPENFPAKDTGDTKEPWEKEQAEEWEDREEAPASEDDAWVSDESKDDLPRTKIIKNITVGLNNRPLMIRSIHGIVPFKFHKKETLLRFELYYTPWYSPKEIQYKYKLEGFDGDWINTDASKRVITYTNLAPGRYVFKIMRSHDRFGLEKELTEEAATFVVSPAFWQTWWFRLMVLLLILGGAFTYVKLKIHRMKKYRDQELKLSQMESKLTQAEIKALKAQLHPHFLFNTLNVISSLMHENVEAADNVLTRLGDLLRLMFSHSGQPMLRLKDEIEFIDIYLEMHMVRFQDKLKVSMDIPDNTSTAMVPNFLLQPLVENAVKYGVSKDRENNKIQVRSQRNGDRLLLVVRDNGPGIPSLETLGSGEVINIDKGIGLKNIQERLQFHYGSDFKFKLENSIDGGLIVSIEIPYNN